MNQILATLGILVLIKALFILIGGESMRKISLKMMKNKERFIKAGMWYLILGIIFLIIGALI